MGKFHNNTINFNGMSENEISINSKPDTDYELNWLSYEEAIRFDKRENCDYYGIYPCDYHDLMIQIFFYLISGFLF